MKLKYSKHHILVILTFVSFGFFHVGEKSICRPLFPIEMGETLAILKSNPWIIKFPRQLSEAFLKKPQY